MGNGAFDGSSRYAGADPPTAFQEDAIRGMLEGLDPHSSYTTAKETRALNEPLNGSFDGIGIQFNVVDDTLLVIQPVVNGPYHRCQRHGHSGREDGS